MESKSVFISLHDTRAKQGAAERDRSGRPRHDDRHQANLGGLHAAFCTAQFTGNGRPGSSAFPRWCFPLNYARYNIDLDLVTRGSGFGCYGSVESKVIFATFTFALERTREALPLWGGPLRWDYQRW